MKKLLTGPLFGVCALALAASLAACGGGGGGGGTTPSTGGGGSTGSGGGGPTPVSSPSNSPTESAAGQLSISGVDLANAKVTFTCGCNTGAGLISTDANGNYTITQSAPAAPAGSGTYQLLGHNVLVVGYATNSNTQAWTMNFVGNSPATDLSLNASDTAATAAALFLYYEVAYNPTIASPNDTDRTFDWFNFNTVSAWVSHLRSGTGLTAAETKLLGDITSAQAAGTSLFPYTPSPNWEPVSDGPNTTISSDLSAVVSGGTAADAALPTPCPAAGQCTGAPSP